MIEDINFLKTAIPQLATQGELAGNQEVCTRVMNVAGQLLRTSPDDLHGLSTPIKVWIVKYAIDAALHAQENMTRYLPFLDHDVIGALSQTPHDSYQKLIQEYASARITRTSTFSLHTPASQEAIQTTLEKLSPEVKRFITQLDLSGCTSLADLSFLKEFPNLKGLNVSQTSIPSLRGVEHLSGLEKLDVTGCLQLEDISALENPGSKLKIFLAPNCMRLSNVQSLENCTKLEELNLSNCHLIRGLLVINKLKNLKKLVLKGLVRLNETSLTTMCTGLCHLEEIHLAHSGVKGISAQSDLRHIAVF